MEGARIRPLLDFAYEVARADDLDEFRAAVTSGIRRLVPADLASYTEVDLKTGSVLAPVDPPIGEHQAISALGRCAHQHPLITRTVGHAQTISDYLTPRQFHHLELYHAVYRLLGAEDQIAISLPARRGLAIGIALNRSRPGFSESDRRTLDQVRPLLLNSYRRALARDRGRGLAATLEHAGSGVISLGLDRRVEFASPLARQLIDDFFHPTPAGALPGTLTDWLDLEGNRAGNQLTVARGSRELMITVILAGPDEPHTLELTETNPDGVKLTARERHILMLVSSGQSNQQIAGTLGLSRRTIENHLQSTYRKLAVTNRTAAAAALWLEPSSP